MRPISLGVLRVTVEAEAVADVGTSAGAGTLPLLTATRSLAFPQANRTAVHGSTIERRNIDLYGGENSASRVDPGACRRRTTRLMNGNMLLQWPVRLSGRNFATSAVCHMWYWKLAVASHRSLRPHPAQDDGGVSSLVASQSRR